MIGKTVKCSKELVCFFYPEFKVLEDVTFLNSEDSVIYVGKFRHNLTGYLKANTKQYISLVGRPEVDYTSRENLVKFVYAKWNRQPPQKLMDMLFEQSDEDFYTCCKKYWVCGHWPYDIDDSATLYTLFSSMNESVKDNLFMLFKMIDKYGAKVVESSILTFLARAIDVDAQEVSAQYKKVLKTFYQRSGNKIRPAVAQYAYKKLTTESNLVDLILSVR